MKRFSVLAAGAVLMLAISTTALAQTAAVERGKSGEVDLRQPTPAEIKHLAEAMKNSLSQEWRDLKAVQRANGTVSLDLQGRFENLSLAKRNADGSVSTSCVSTSDEAVAFLKAKAKKAAANGKAARVIVITPKQEVQ